MVTGLILSVFWLPPMWLALTAMIPMAADGLIQLKTAYESTNPRRFATGLLFGWALTAFAVITLGLAFRSGYTLGLQLR